MTASQSAAYVIANSIAAMAEIEGMKAENRSRVRRKASLAYTEEAFNDVVNKYGIHHNAMITLFEESE